MNDKWIPVEKELPKIEENGLSKWVLTTLWNGNKSNVFYDRLTRNGWLCETESTDKVVAWQPLPEPYRKETQ